MLAGAADLRSGRGTVGPGHNSTPSPTADPWRPSDGTRIFTVELRETGLVSKITPRSPAPFLGGIALPINKKLETSAITANINNLVHLPSPIPIG